MRNDENQVMIERNLFRADTLQPPEFLTAKSLAENLLPRRGQDVVVMHIPQWNPHHLEAITISKFIL